MKRNERDFPKKSVPSIGVPTHTNSRNAPLPDGDSSKIAWSAFDVRIRCLWETSKVSNYNWVFVFSEFFFSVKQDKTKRAYILFYFLSEYII